MVIGFGILGTILMMTLEHNREFGMLIAIGMKRSRMSVIVVLESLIISFVGVILGIIVSIPVIVYFYFNPIKLTGDMAQFMLKYGFEPIMPFSLDPAIFLMQAFTVLIIALFVSLYPLFRIARIKPVQALKTI
jgi:ABC-type antimicrobial peptide transport system permease subunit